MTATLKYLAAHTASLGGLAFAIGYALTGRPTEAVNALLVALAGFGLNLRPSAQ